MGGNQPHFSGKGLKYANCTVVNWIFSASSPVKPCVPAISALLYEFNALGAKGVLCGWEFTTYELFQDAPEQVAVPEEKVTYASLWGNVLAGLILVTVAAVAVAYVASTVFTMGASATVAPLVIGGLVGAVGSAMVFASADRDVANNENSGPIAYMFNGLVGALTGAVLGTVIILSPFAAETAVMMYAPVGVDIFGKNITPATLTNFASIGCYLTTSLNALFKTFESQEMVSGENLLKEKMPEGVYNDLSDMSAAGTGAIVVMGLMNPNYMSGPKEAAGNITQKANSVEERLSSKGFDTTRINIAKGPTRFSPSKNAGWKHILERHFSPGKNAGQFTITQEELKGILGNERIINTPGVPSTVTDQYTRIVNVGKTVGTIKPSIPEVGGNPTTWITIITDIKGNLITTYPCPAPN